MGVQTVIKDYGTSILNAVRDNDVKAFASLMDKYLKADHKIAALCVTDIKHKPTKKFACPLILAARQEEPHVLRYMLDKGVDPNFVHHTVYSTKRREIVTALHIAVDLGHFATVEALLNANADPNIKDHNNETSLHIAVKKADRVMTQMLLSRGADASILDHRGNAALHIATMFGHLQLVKILLKYDADVYQRGHLSAIPSHIAAREGHIHLVQVFCSRDVGNINIKIPCFADQREKAPIHLAAENGHVETIIALLDQFNADVNLKDSDGNTALHCVVLQPYQPNKMRDKDFYYAAAKVLVKYRVSINEKNVHGQTALHLAAANHHQKIVELLLSVGANAFAEDVHQLKPIDVVLESDPVTKQMLKDAMTNTGRAPIHASMLSLHKDLNISLPGFPPHQISATRLPSDHPAAISSRSFSALPQSSRVMNHPGGLGANASFRSTSSISSVFADDIKGRQAAASSTLRGKTSGGGGGGGGGTGAGGGLPPRPLEAVEEKGRRNERENEIPAYAPVERKSGEKGRQQHHHHHHHRHRDRGDSASDAGSMLSINSRDDDDRGPGGRGDRGPGGRDDPRNSPSKYRSPRTAVEEENARNREKSQQQMMRDKSGGYSNGGRGKNDNDYKSGNSPYAKGKRGVDAEESFYENADFIKGRSSKNSPEKETEEERRLRKERKRQEQELADGAGRHRIGMHDYEDEDGVRVHTVPGKPQLIEVSYANGPITISVDTSGANNNLDNAVIYANTGDYGRNGHRDDDDDDDDDDQSVKKHRHHHNHHRKQRGEEPLYYNQEMIQAEMKQRQEQKARAEKAAQLQKEREERIEAEAERQRQKLEEEEKLARKEEREKRRAKKMERRKNRQDQYEVDQEEVPTEELATERLVYVHSIPDEIRDEPEFDSDGFEKETKKKKDIAKEKAYAVAEGIRRRWSQDESDDDDDDDEGRHRRGKTQQRPSSASSNGSRKPPRPSLCALDSNSDAAHHTSDGTRTPDFTINPFPAPTPNPESQGQAASPKQTPEAAPRRKSADLLSDNRKATDVIMDGRKSADALLDGKKSADMLMDGRKSADMLSDSRKNQPFIAQVRETKSSHIEKLAVAEVPGREVDKKDDTTVVKDSVAYDQDPEYSGEVKNEKYIYDEIRPGLNMRVTGEVPKAYSRSEHSSARRAFMMAPPVGIESSSDASDSEFGSRRSLTENAGSSEDRRKSLIPVSENKEDQNVEKTTTDKLYGKKFIGGYAKPYESFGKIETNTDALEEALKEYSQNNSVDRLLSPGGDVSLEYGLDEWNGKSIIPSKEFMVHSDNKQSKTHHQQEPRDDDDDSFENDSFEEGSTMELDPQSMLARGIEVGLRRKPPSDQPKAPAVSDESQLIKPKKVIGTPTPLVSGTDKNVKGTKPNDVVEALVENKFGARRASEALSDSELESYDQEPGARRPRPRDRGGDVNSQTAQPKAQEDVEPSKSSGKDGVKKPKKSKTDPGKAEKKSGKTKRLPPLQMGKEFENGVIAPDVWEEAMSGSPLASSEMIEKIGLPDEGETKIGGGSKKISAAAAAKDLRKNRDSVRNKEENRGSKEDLLKDTGDTESQTSDRVVGRRQQRQEKGGASPATDTSQDVKPKAAKRKPKNETNLDDVEMDEKTRHKSSSSKLGKENLKPHAFGTIHIEPGNRRPVFTDHIYENTSEELKRNSLSREKLDDVVSHLRQEYDSEHFDEDLHELPQSTFQIPDIVPLSSFEKHSGPPRTGSEGELDRWSPIPPRRGGGTSGKQGLDNKEPGLEPRGGPRTSTRTSKGHPSGIHSDTEVGRIRPRPSSDGRDYSTRQFSTGRIHSEAEASDIEPPRAPAPGRSYSQAAMESIYAGTVRRTLPPRGPVVILRQPGHHDKDFSYYKKLFKPPRHRASTRAVLTPGAGRYGDSELTRSRSRSATGTESDTDGERRRSGSRRRHRGPDLPPSIMEPGPVDFNKYDITARLWMEQVDRKTVQKSNTMYLSVLPKGHELPRELLGSRKFSDADSSSTVPPQWVIARGRMIRVQKLMMSGDLPGSANRYLPPGKQLVLFFKVGSNWLDLAWVLFSGLQTDPETVRMIKDVQLKNPGGLSDQVHDLMHRWWRRKGNDATIEELQRALDMVHMAYIQEEFRDPHGSVFPYSDTEDDLDLGEVTDADPNVSRLMQEYESRSLNSSSSNLHPNLPTPPPNPDLILRKLQQSGVLAPQSTALVTRASKASHGGGDSRDASPSRAANSSRANSSSQEDSLDRASSEEELKPRPNPKPKTLTKPSKPPSKQAAPPPLPPAKSAAPSAMKGTRVKPVPMKKPFKRETHL